MVRLQSKIECCNQNCMMRKYSTLCANKTIEDTLNSQVNSSIKDFKIQRRGWQRKRHKNNRFNEQNNNFACASHFCTFLSRFCTTTTWKCLISRLMENINKQWNFISLSECRYGLLKLALGGFAYNWKSKWVGINAIKTERMRIDFLSDILVAITLLDL